MTSNMRFLIDSFDAHQPVGPVHAPDARGSEATSERPDASDRPVRSDT